MAQEDRIVEELERLVGNTGRIALVMEQMLIMLKDAMAADQRGSKSDEIAELCESDELKDCIGSAELSKLLEDEFDVVTFANLEDVTRQELETRMEELQLLPWFKRLNTEARKRGVKIGRWAKD
jgi:hypothetical protein